MCCFFCDIVENLLLFSESMYFNKCCRGFFVCFLFRLVKIFPLFFFKPQPYMCLYKCVDTVCICAFVCLYMFLPEHNPEVALPSESSFYFDLALFYFKHHPSIPIIKCNHLSACFIHFFITSFAFHPSIFCHFFLFQFFVFLLTPSGL